MQHNLMPHKYTPSSSDHLAFLSIMPSVLVMNALLPPCQIRLDDRNRSENTESGDGPRNDFNNLDLVAETQATLDLALEFVEAIGDAIVLALDVTPHLVDQHTGDDPEDGRDDKEDLAEVSATGICAEVTRCRGF